MRFLYPTLFVSWALLIAVPIVLYLFRPRPRTVRTSTLPFFKWLAKEHQDAAWLKWLKHLLSLLLSVLVVLAAAAALGRLVSAPSSQSLNTLVILVDRSASMGTVDASGITRLDAGLKRVEQRLAGLPAGVGVVVMSYDRRPEVLLARNTEPRQVQRALATIRVRPIEGDYDAAIGLARRLAELDTPTEIWHITDHPRGQPTDEEQGNDEAAPDDVPAESESNALAGGEAGSETRVADGEPAAQAISVETIDVSIPGATNVGITAFQMQRAPLERSRFEAFVQLSASSTEPVEAEMEIKMDDRLVAVRRLTIQPSGRESLLIPIEADYQADTILTLDVSAGGDVLAADNSVHVRVPKLRPISVLWVSQQPNPFLELALSSLGSDDEFQVLHGPPSAWPPSDPVDVVIFDGWLPDQWPQDTAAVVMDPPGSLGPVQAVRLEGVGLPIEDLRATDDSHPLMYGVASGRIAVTQTVVLEADGPLQPLWVASQGPLLLAGESEGQRVVVFGFSPQMSVQLPLMASYPLLIGNAIYWASEKEAESIRGGNHRTGALVALEGKSITWQVPSQGEPDNQTVTRQNEYAELDRIGLWETEAGETGSAALLSAHETLLVAATEEAAVEEGVTTSSWLRGDLAPLLLWTIVVILVGESLLFHRYLAY